MSALSKTPDKSRDRRISNLYDPVSERTILSAILAHGSDMLYHIDGTIKEIDFFSPENKIIYSTLRKMVVEQQIKELDSTTILSLIKAVDPDAIRNYDITDYLMALSQDSVPKENVDPFCQIVARLSLARNLQARLRQSADALDNVTGQETISQIMEEAERPIVQFSNGLVSNDETISLGDEVLGFLETLVTTAGTHRGIPTGYPKYDKAIGGGLRKPGVHLIGARAKQGKSFLCVNMARNMVKNGVKVLYLDTELTPNITMARYVSLLSGVTIDEIEAGAFCKNPEKVKKIDAAVKEAKERKFHYHNIAGRPHSEWISIMRRWIMKEVGFDAEGNTKECVIILDYIKMMDLNDAGKFAEYQYLGQIITDLHNFCVKYNLPILSMVQLNREGISGSGQGVIADSDRLMRLCSSFSIFRKKETEDFADDPPRNGNRKLEIIDCRFGPSLDDGEYINLFCDFSVAKITEGQTNLENRANRGPGPIKGNNNTIQADLNDDDDSEETII